MYRIPRIKRAITARPPTTPPAMAPAGLNLASFVSGAGVEVGVAVGPCEKAGLDVGACEGLGVVEVDRRLEVVVRVVVPVEVTVVVESGPSAG
jgi:hypothetical protein